jgi:PKD repeat protein
MFITMEATPDHLLVVQSNKAPQISHISAQLKNQLGQGVPGEHIRLQIVNTDGSVVAIGAFDGSVTCRGGHQAECTTDSGGFVRADYVAPYRDQDVVPVSIRIYIFATLTNSNYTFEITDRHALDLQVGEPNPGGNCGLAGLNPNFTFLPVAPAIGDQVCFDASTSTSTSTVTSIKWQYGDGHGDITNNPSPCHTYTFAGLYNVTLTLKDVNTNLCSFTQTVPVTGGLPPVCGSIIINPGGAVEPGVTYTFTSLATDPDSGIKRYSWNFGDGGSASSTSNSAKHKYNVEGTFTILLTITDTQGNETLCTLSVTVGTPTNLPPVCSFTISPTDPAVGQAVAFNAIASTDPDGSIVAYLWDFGDLSPAATSVNPTNTYSAPGSYTVTLLVTDDGGSSTVCSQTVTVACPTVTLSPATLGGPYSIIAGAIAPIIMSASPGAGFGFAVTSGSLPPGLALSGAGVFSGTPVLPTGSYSFTVTATAANGCSGSTAYTVVITP